MDRDLLWHTHVLDDGGEDVKLFGIYATEEQAQRRLAQAQTLPRFRDARDGFELSACGPDGDAWTEAHVHRDGLDLATWLANPS